LAVKIQGVAYFKGFRDFVVCMLIQTLSLYSQSTA